MKTNKIIIPTQIKFSKTLTLFVACFLFITNVNAQTLADVQSEQDIQNFELQIQETEITKNATFTAIKNNESANKEITANNEEEVKLLIPFLGNIVITNPSTEMAESIEPFRTTSAEMEKSVDTFASTDATEKKENLK